MMKAFENYIREKEKMSNNGTQEVPKLDITCTRCTQKFSRELPKPEISNNLRSSVVTMSHEQLVRCPNAKCRQPFVWMVQGAQVVFNVVAVDDDVVEQVEGSKLVKSALELVGGNH